MSIFPTSSDADPADSEPRVVGLDEDETGDLLQALTSDTAREVVVALQADARTVPELAEELGVTPQTVHYHLDRLRDAGAVTAVDTVYSEKGQEMDVYATTNGSLVIHSGDEDERDVIRRTLSRFLGAVGFLAVVSVAVQRLLEDPARVTDTAGQAGGYGTGGGAVGLAVFCVGLVVIGFGFWVARRRR